MFLEGALSTIRGKYVFSTDFRKYVSAQYCLPRTICSTLVVHVVQSECLPDNAGFFVAVSAGDVQSLQRNLIKLSHSLVPSLDTHSSWYDLERVESITTTFCAIANVCAGECVLVLLRRLRNQVIVIWIKPCELRCLNVCSVIAQRLTVSMLMLKSVGTLARMLCATIWFAEEHLHCFVQRGQRPCKLFFICLWEAEWTCVCVCL